MRRLTNHGFTLTELAVVLVIVALLIGGMLMPLSAQMDLRDNSETERGLRDIREALIGFAASHSANDTKPRLPCPDTDNDGRENFNVGGTACANQEGRIPWVDLGLGQTDAWNNRYRYRVTAAFSDPKTGFTLPIPPAVGPSDLRICTDATCGTALASAVPVVVLSHGKNGAGAFNSSGGPNPAPTGDNEKENTDGANTDFVSKTPDPNFDDLVIWLSPNILYNRMITAGRLP